MDPDTQLIFKAVKAIHARIGKLESRIHRQERKAKTVLRLYNRFYAQGRRRTKAEAAMLQSMRHSWRTWEGHTMRGHVQRIGMMLRRLGAQKGYLLPMLTPAENTKFRSWLKKDLRK